MARIASFVSSSGQNAVGLVSDSEIVQLSAARDGLRGLLGRGELSAAVAGPHGGMRHPLESVRVGPPISDPGKIVGVGLNYVSHADEAGREVPEYPTLFAKFRNTIAGPYDPITIPRVTHRIDYEGELAVVIGRRGRYIAAEAALDHVAGFMVANDVSARDYQFRTKEMLSGKTFDGFAPTGPYLVTPDEVGELADLTLTTDVNGERRQTARLGDMIFSVPRLVAYISDIVTLEPGDIILTGTPAGIGATMEPRRWLRPGDVVEISIENVGTIRNTVVSEPA